MSPIEILLVAACIVLVALATATAVATTVRSRRTETRMAGLEAVVERLREQVEELARRESARETAEAVAHSERTERDPADWVITFDEPDRTAVPGHRAATLVLGEPLIKIAAFSHGVRQALREERRAHLAYQVRRDYRQRRRATRARARAAR
ncbi:MAG: hypothetical protein ACRDOY_03190 [Nocardioidaceae bacterium]